MIFQNYALYPHMYAVRQHGVRAQDAGRRRSPRSTGACARRRGCSGSPTCSRKRPRTLSGGQRQRVAMGRAIVREPRAFLMDEPLSNLDAKLRVQMRAEIARIQRDLSVTTIYVTHDQSEAMTLGDRVAVMRKGELQQLDTPQRLYRDPVNLFVAEFIGSPAMNLVEAELERRRRARAASASTALASTRRRRAPASRALRGPHGRARDPARGPRGRRARRRTPRRTARSPAASTSARTWARRSSSTSRSTRRPSRPRTSRRRSRTDGGRGARGAGRAARDAVRRARRPRVARPRGRPDRASPSTRAGCTSSTSRPARRSRE